MENNMFIYGILMFIPIIMCIFGFINMKKTKVEDAVIIEKKTNSVGNIRYIVAEINGEKFEFRTNYYVFTYAPIGENVKLWHNGNFCSRFSK